MRKLFPLHLVVLLILLLTGCLERGLAFQIRFQELSGLKKEDRIYFQGNEVGLVRQVAYTKEGDFLVDVAIKPEFINAATVDSRFYLTDDPALSGRKAITIIQPVAGGKVLARGSIVQGSVQGGIFQELLSGLSKHLDSAADELNLNLDRLKKSLLDASLKLNAQLERSLAELADKLDSLQRELEQAPTDEEIRQLEELIAQLAEELKRAEADVRLQIQRQWLPYLRQELDSLRERLKRQGREGELDQLQRQVERMNSV